MLSGAFLLYSPLYCSGSEGGRRLIGKTTSTDSAVLAAP